MVNQFGSSDTVWVHLQLPLLCAAAVTASSCADDGSADLQGPLQRQVNLGQAAAPEAMDPDQRVPGIPAKSSINSPRYYSSGDQWRNWGCQWYYHQSQPLIVKMQKFEICAALQLEADFDGNIIDRKTSVSLTFNGNGLAVAPVRDFENTSFTTHAMVQVKQVLIQQILGAPSMTPSASRMVVRGTKHVFLVIF